MSAVIATIGHNLPPEPTPFEMSREEIDGLVTEARNWLDGSGVKSDADADAVSKLIDMLRKAIKTADERRIAENKPFDDGKAEVQARYAPLIADTKSVKGVAVIAIETAKAALAPYLKRKDDELKAKAAEARRIADEQAAAAVEAIRAARQGVPDLEAREDAERLLAGAIKAETIAAKGEGAKAHATGGARAIGLRTVWRATMTDANEAANHYWVTRRPEVDAFFQGLADADVRAGKRSIPGFSITEEKVL